MTKRTTRRTPRSQQRLEQQGPTLAAARPRFAAQKGRGRSWLGSLLLLGLALFFVVRFVSDPRFRVAQVSVEGANLVTREEIEARADLLGKPIFAVNAREIEARLLEAYGCLGRVQVHTRLPDRVEIRVHEEQVLLLWQSQGLYWWVDGEGRVLGVAGGRGELPAIHDRSARPVALGEYIVGVPWGFAIEMSRALPEVRDFEFTLEDGLIVIVAEGWPVYLGTGGDPEQKAVLLRELSQTLAASGGRVVYVDLKNELRPFVKVQSG